MLPFENAPGLCLDLLKRKMPDLAGAERTLDLLSRSHFLKGDPEETGAVLIH